MEEREWKGRWWLPGREEAAVGGDLKLAPDELVLVLDGELPHDPIELPPDGRITEFFRPVVEPIVLGLSRERERLTLIDAEGALPTIPVAVDVTRWRPTAVLVGEHVEDREEMVFDALQFGFDYLYDWARPAPPSHSLGATGRVEIAGEVEVIGSAEVDDATVELAAEPRWSIGDARGEIEVLARFRVKTAEGISWRAGVDEWLRPLRNLVSLGSLRASRIGKVALRVAGSDGPAWAELLLRWTDLSRPARTERSLIPQDILFTARELPGGFAEGVRRWFEIHRRHSAVVELLLGVSYAPFIMSEQRFLALSQATEIYHREAIGGMPLPKAEHKRRVQEILKGVTDPDLAHWARSVLQEANRLQLAERVAGVIERLGDLGCETIGEDFDGFVRRVVQTRNYLTHRDKRQPAVLEEPARYWHGQALDWLLRASLLLDLGFNIDEAASRIRRNTRYQWFRAQLQGAAS